MQAFEVLLEGTAPEAPTPADLAEIYGGPIGFAAPVVYSNFVESLDGVVALEARESSGSVISGHHDGDRFLMALLRACADAVLLGAGTLRATPNHRWVAEAVFPDLAVSFAELRRQRGLAPEPRLVRLFARRFTVQERMGQQIADTLVDILEPHGVAVHLEAMHLCTQMRGVREENSHTWTSFWRGGYEDAPELRSEFLNAAHTLKP